MRTKLLILFCLLISCIIKAQDIDTPVEKRYVYTAVANVRNDPGVEFDKIDELYCGQEVTVLKHTEILTDIRGYNRVWLKISYEKEGTLKEGYLWEGNLSYTQIRRGDVKFVFGIDFYDEKEYAYKGTIKAVKGKDVIASASYKIQTELNYIGGRVINQPNLSNVEYVIDLTFSGEACAIPTVNSYFAWNGSSILPIIQTTSVSDACAMSYGEGLIFPTDDGLDILIVLISSGTNPDETLETCDFDWKYKTKVYFWNGNKAIEQDQNWKD